MRKNTFDWTNVNQDSAQAKLEQVESELRKRGGYLQPSGVPSVDFDKMEFELDGHVWRLKRNRWVNPKSPSQAKRCIWYAVRQVGTAWEKVHFPREYGLLVESMWVERSLLEDSK